MTCSRVNFTFTFTFYLQLMAHFCLLLLNISSFFISCLPIYFPFVRTLLVSFSRVIIFVPLFSCLDFSTIIFMVSFIFHSIYMSEPRVLCGLGCFFQESNICTLSSYMVRLSVRPIVLCCSHIEYTHSSFLFIVFDSLLS